MNRYVALGALGVGLMMSPLFLDFASSAVPQQPKIGVIDIEKTLQETPAGKRANENFEKTRKAKQDELDKKKQEFLKANDDLQKQASVLKPDVLQKKKDELEKQYAELGKLAATLERDLAVENAKLTQELLKQAEPIVKDIAKSEGVTLILDVREVVWFDPTMDLTDKLNAKMK
jgi:outer membrane protein